MDTQLSLSPRYTLDAPFPWLMGIDPVRRYWVHVNGESSITVAIPGLTVSSHRAFREAVISFRSLAPGESLLLPTSVNSRVEIRCIAENLYAIPYAIETAKTWHLFDYETIEALLLTAHPDWQCSPQDMALGRDLLQQSWQQPSAA